MSGSISVSRPSTEVVVNDFVRSVYNWMCIGLALTGFMAFYVSNNETMLRLVFSNQLIFFGLIIAELVMVFSLVSRVNRMSAGTATSLFVAYSALNGVTLSFVFLLYTSASIVSTFFICSATFLACSIYGWTTKKDLTSFWRVSLDGPVRDYYCVFGQYVYPKQCDAYDDKLYRRLRICWIDRLRYTEAEEYGAESTCRS